jgi:PAS domain S-box-containing protein
VKELPELFDLRVKARSLAYLFAAGAVVGVLTFMFPPAAVMELQLGITWGIALLLAIGLWLRADRVREWHLYVVLAAGTVLLTFANYYAGVGALYALLFSWIALYAFYFFELRAALVYVGLIAIGYTIILADEKANSSVIRWLLAVGTPTVAGLLISRLHTRLRAEAAAADERGRDLRRSESRTRLILDSAPDAFVAIDSDGVITTWNAAAERMFGWSAGEVVGRPLREVIFPPDGRGGHEERRRDLAQASDPVRIMRVELDLQRRDGSTFPAEEVISRVRLGDDYVTSGFIRDISERRRRQEEREALMREQAARAEAERVAEMVSGMQLLVDAALAHRGIDDILADLVARVRGVLGADAATIFLAGDNEQLVVRATSAGVLEDDRPEPIAFGDRFAGRVASLREPLLAQDPDPADVQDLAMGALDIDSLIGVPLLAEGNVTGVLVTGAARPRRFSGEDLNLLRLAADRVALAIMHAQVYEREHRIAETLQRSLLPERLPQVPGLVAAARYLPAATEAEVGDDWYDMIPIPGGGVGLVMGDVAGKGLAAASMVGRLRSALRAYALEGHDPARVVEQLNRLVWTEAEESQMATLLYLIVDPGNDQVSWVNAGHPPPLLVQDGSGEPARYLEGGRSVPLGVLPFPNFEEVVEPLHPGTTIVLYTDGLVERPGDHLDLGLDRLAEIVREAPEDPEALCDHVLASLVPAGGAPDDVALLALQNTPLVDRFRVEFPTQPEALVSMRSLLRRWLRQTDGSEREIAEIITACGEAATNAIEHAGASGGTPFEIAGHFRDGVVDIAVRDYGAWRPPREGDQGRGLSLMRALMGDVEVQPSSEGTTVRLSRRLGVRENGDGQ